MTLEERFEDAATRSKSLPKQDNNTLLEIYSLYKQATKGDVSGPKPGMFDMVGKAKHDAWAKLQGTAKEDAMARYITLIDSLAS